VTVLVVIAAALVNVALFVVVVAMYAWIEFSADIGSYSFLPCHGRGRGFESRRPRHFKSSTYRNGVIPAWAQKGTK
jgi:hypothetical protein